MVSAPTNGLQSDGLRTGGLETGVVEAPLPRSLFRVRLDSGQRVEASLGAQARQVVVALLPGDRVSVIRSKNDPGRGRITAKLI